MTDSEHDVYDADQHRKQSDKLQSLEGRTRIGTEVAVEVGVGEEEEQTQHRKLKTGVDQQGRKIQHKVAEEAGAGGVRTEVEDPQGVVVADITRPTSQPIQT